MKGMVFVELTEFLEAQFGYELVDDLIEAVDPPSKGAYTRVGTYPYTEVVALVQALSNRIQVPASALYKAFGEHLFARLAAGHPEFLPNAGGALPFLRTIENHIHVEVKKLYPDAELPTFEYLETGADGVHMIYRSTRGFGDLAEGLIHGCLKWFGAAGEVAREDLAEGGTQVRFVVRTAADQRAA